MLVGALTQDREAFEDAFDTALQFLLVVKNKAAHAQVFTHSHLWKQRPLLRHETDAFAQDLVWAHAVQAFALEDYIAFADRQHAADGFHQRRFAGAVRADDAMDLAGLDGQMGAVEDCRAIAVTGGDIGDLKQLRHHAAS